MIRKLALAVLLPLLMGCAYNEELGRSQLLLVDDNALAGSANQAWTETLRQSRVSNDAALRTRVTRVADRILDAAGLRGQPWEIVVFQDDTPNAFVLPGNKMGVNTGIFTVAANDDQLAAVIGHEVAHSLAHHAAERASQTVAASIALQSAQGAAGDSRVGQAISAYGGAGAQLGFLLPFSRRHELEADRIGVDLMQRAGFNPRQAVELWRRMAQQGGGSPEFASTHPSDSTRIDALSAYIQQQGW